MENITAYSLNELSVDPGGTGMPTASNPAHPETEGPGTFDQKLAKAELAFRDGQMTPDQMGYKNLAEEVTYALSGLKSLRLSMDPELKRVVVRVVDKRTNNVVGQLPSKQMVDLVKQMRDLEGLLFKVSA